MTRLRIQVVSIQVYTNLLLRGIPLRLKTATCIPFLLIGNIILCRCRNIRETVNTQRLHPSSLLKLFNRYIDNIRIHALNEHVMVLRATYKYYNKSRFLIYSRKQLSSRKYNFAKLQKKNVFANTTN